MTIRHLRIFLSVCSNDYNTTKAAAELLMTQPAVSLAVRELEQYYGVNLFERMGRRLKITEAGRRFQEYSVRIIAMFDDMERAMRDWDSFGILRVGASITIGSRFLPGYVKAFHGVYPGTEVRAVIGPSEQLEQKILENKLDIALIEGIVHSPSLVCEEYMEDSLVVICQGNGAFRQGQILTVDEFRQQKFLLREEGSGTREIFDRVTAQAGFMVMPVWEAMSTTALINAVISGLGVSVLPYRLVTGALERGLVVAVNVQGLDFGRKFKIIYHKEKFLTASARMFMELCRNYEAEHPPMEYQGLY